MRRKKYTVRGAFRDDKDRVSINFGLHDHRIREVRRALRNSYLAYAFINGIKRVSVEHKCYVEQNYNEVARLAYKYGYSVHKTYDRVKFSEVFCKLLFADEPYDIGLSPASVHIGQSIVVALKNM